MKKHRNIVRLNLVTSIDNKSQCGWIDDSAIAPIYARDKYGSKRAGYDSASRGKNYNEPPSRNNSGVRKVSLFG